MQGPRNPREIPGSLLVMAAECAARLGEFATANEALALYCRVAPPRDQFWCRHLLVKALLVYESSVRGARGRRKVHSVEKAVEFVLEALAIATEIPERKAAYNHIVYNASVVHWRVTRCLQRDGYSAKVIKSSTQLVAAVEGSNAQEVEPRWLIDLYVQAGYCCFDAKDGRAKDFIEKAIAIAVKNFPDDVPMRLRLLKYRVHVDVKTGDSMGSKPEFKEFPAKAVLGIQKARSIDPPSDRDKLLVELEALLKGLETKEGDVDPEKLYTVGQVGQLALDRGLVGLARECARRGRAIQQLGGLYHAGVMAEIVQHQLDILEPPRRVVAALERCTTRDQQRARLATNRLEKLRELVASLLSAQRLKDAELTEDCCQIIWNNMLPLLEPRFYKEIEGILSACATALAKIDSNRNRLRVLLHLEFAKCQEAAELLNNAATEIKKALALDYTLADSQLGEAQRALITEEEIEKIVEGQERLDLFEYARDLDIQIGPIARTLALKQDMQRAPANAEEVVITLLEQIKESKQASRSTKRKLLEKAVEAFENDPLDGRAEEGTEPRLRLEMERGRLWFEAATLAFGLKLYDLTTHSISRVLRREWDESRPSQRPLLLQQAEACSMLARCCAADLVAAGTTPGTVADDRKAPLLDDDDAAGGEGGDSKGGAEAKKAARDRSAQGRLLRALIKAQTIGLKLRDVAIPSNALREMWNLHLDAIASQSRRFAESAVAGTEIARAEDAPVCHSLYKALEQAHRRLWPVEGDAKGKKGGADDADSKWAPPVDETNEALLIAVGTAVARYLEECGDGEACVSFVQGTLSALAGNTAAVDNAEALLQSLARASGAAEPSPMPERATAKCVVWLEMLRQSEVEEKAKIDITQKIQGALEELGEGGDDGGDESAAKAGSESKGSAGAAFKLPGLRGAIDMQVEYRTTLWAQLAVEACALKLQRLVVIAADSAAEDAMDGVPKDLTGGTPFPVDSLRVVTMERWHWLCQADCAAGRSILSQIDPKTQDRQLQDHLRALAIARFARAAFFGGWCAARAAERVQHRTLEAAYPLGSQLLHAAKLFWNSAGEFLRDAVTRRLIQTPAAVVQAQLSRVLAIFSDRGAPNPKIMLEPAFRVNIAALLAQCCYDQKEYEKGLDLTVRLLREFPQRIARPVYKLRVLLLLQTGRDVEKDILNIGGDGGDNVMLKANLYASLARAASSPERQFAFYGKAIDALSGSSDPVQSVPLLVEFAEWMYARNMGRQATQDQLLMVADVLLEQEETGDTDDLPIGSQASSSRRSQASRSVRRLFKTPSKAGGSVFSRGSRSKAPSRATPKRGSGAGLRSRKGSGASIAASRKSSRGSFGAASSVAPSPPRLKIAHLATLFRVYCMLARIASNRRNALQLTLVAQSFVMRIWSSTYAALREVPAAAGDAKGAEAGNGAAAPPSMPESLLDWADWELDSALRGAVERSAAGDDGKEKDDAKGGGQSVASGGARNPVPLRERVANSVSLEQPEILTYYLKWAYKALESGGFVAQALPVLALLELASECSAPPGAPETSVLARLWRARLCDSLLLRSRADALLEAATPVVPAGDRAAAHNERVEAREALNKLIHKDPALRLEREGAGAVSSPPAGDGSQSARKPANANKLLQRGKLVVRRGEAQGDWLEMAAEVARRGRMGEATQLLALARRHALAFRDTVALVEHRRARALLHLLGGSHQHAITLAEQVQCLDGDSDWWQSVVLLLVSAYLGFSVPIEPNTVGLRCALALGTHQTPELLGDPLAGAREPELQAQQALVLAIGLFEGLSRGDARATGGADYMSKAASLKRVLAEVATMRAPFARDEGAAMSNPKEGPRVRAALSRAFGLLLQSADAAEQLCDDSALIRALRSFADIVTRAHASPFDSPPVHAVVARARGGVRGKSSMKPSTAAAAILDIPPEADAVSLQVAKALLEAAEERATQAVYEASPSFLPPGASLPAARELQAIKLDLAALVVALSREERYLNETAPPVGGADADAAAAKLMQKYRKVFQTSAESVGSQTPGQRAMLLASSARSLQPARHDAVAFARCALALGEARGLLAAEKFDVYNEDADGKGVLSVWLAPPERKGSDESKAAGEATVEGGDDSKVEGDGGEGDEPAEGATEESEVPLTEEEKQKRDAEDALRAERETALQSALPLASRALESIADAVSTAIGCDDCEAVSRACAAAADVVGVWDAARCARFICLGQAADVRAHALALSAQSLPAKHPERLAANFASGLVERSPVERARAPYTKAKTFLETKSPAYQRTRLDVVAQYRDDDAAAGGKGKGKAPAPADPDADGDEKKTPVFFSPEREAFAEDWDRVTRELCLNPEREGCVYITVTYRPDRHALFGCTLEGVAPTGDDVPADAPRQLSSRVARMVLSKEREAELRGLQARAAGWRRSLGREIGVFQNDSKAPSLRRCEEELDALRGDLEGLVTPLFAQMGIGDGALEGKTVVLLLDRQLFGLPWEGLGAVSGAATVARDFSMVMQFQRTMAARGEGAGGASGVPRTDVRYIVDPDDPTEERALAAAFAEEAASELKSWEGLTPTDHVPSDGEWQKLLSSAGVFAYAGCGPLFARVSALRVSPLDMSKAGIVCLNARVAQAEAQRTQSKLDNLKSRTQREFETVYNTALLLSLRGVQSVVMNQYAVSIESAAAYQRQLMRKLLAGKPAGALSGEWRWAIVDAPAKGKKSKGAKASGDDAPEGSNDRTLEVKGSGVRLYDRLNPIVCGLASASLKA